VPPLGKFHGFAGKPLAKLVGMRAGLACMLMRSVLAAGCGRQHVPMTWVFEAAIWHAMAIISLPGRSCARGPQNIVQKLNQYVVFFQRCSASPFQASFKLVVWVTVQRRGPVHASRF